jgi:hypothetical protein
MPPIPKEPSIKIEISSASFHEIADALAKQGYKLGDNADVITLHNGTKIEQPIDFRLANVRKDAGLIAARAFNPSDIGIDFVIFMDKIYQYIINGKQEGWK